MENDVYNAAMRRIRRLHFLHYPVQGALMTSLVLATGRRTAHGGADNPQLATWPNLFVVMALLAVVGVFIHFVSSYIRPNLRRPAAENLRLYQGRIFLRNSLLSLACLPPLAAYAVGGSSWNLVLFGVLLLVPCLVTAPSAQTYQRWLMAAAR